MRDGSPESGWTESDRDRRRRPDGLAIAMDLARFGVLARSTAEPVAMHSLVRESAGLAFSGAKYQQAFVLADVEMEWPLSREEVSLFFSPAGLVVVAPLPHNRFRIVAIMDEAPEHPAIGDVQSLLDSRGPAQHPARVSKLLWGSRFFIHHRVASEFWKDRILLAGDAAHVHSPAGGQGMNTGIQDAVELSQALVAKFNGAGDAVLAPGQMSAARLPEALSE